jgi:alkylation response protein AidB-like acyl-CoA dehydrogenase
MASFFTDNDDLKFYFDRGIDWAELAAACERGAGGDTAEAVALFRDIAALVGELAAEEVAPRAARTDREGARLEGGEAVGSAAMAEIFERLRALDLHKLPLPREVGGLNAPVTLWFLCGEMLARGDVSVMVHNSFFAGIAMALMAYSLYEGSGGTRFRKEIEELARGDAWGSMDITEPDAGSDMAALRAVGERSPDGGWTVSGQKIFITSGHGKYHIVVARTGPKPGLDGLSMFLVKAYDDQPDGTRVRHVTVDRVEEKMGHHGSVTCALTFDKAPAELIGQVGEGFRYMLLLMNNARLAVGFESLGLCEAAYRLAASYAAGRRSMGKPIAQHELIADYLDEMRTDIQGIRALAVHAAVNEELGRRLAMPGEVADVRAAEHQARARRATPLLKYLAAEKAVEMARRGVQIHGGIGYMREYPAEKLLRDAIVMPIYEGTSQIQSLMAMKDTLAAIMKKPQAFLTRVAQARWRATTARDELERRVAKLQKLSLSAQQQLAMRTAALKLKSMPVTDWARAFTKTWDPKRDFALALLHAERLTRLLADELIAEVLLEQARRFPERRELLERWLERAEPRCRALHTEITTTGARLLATLMTQRPELQSAG